jgi:hypothetical protein
VDFRRDSAEAPRSAGARNCRSDGFEHFARIEGAMWVTRAT